MLKSIHYCLDEEHELTEFSYGNWKCYYYVNYASKTVREIKWFNLETFSTVSLIQNNTIIVNGHSPSDVPHSTEHFGKLLLYLSSVQTTMHTYGIALDDVIEQAKTAALREHFINVMEFKL